jgi:hypothetical protein
VRFWAFSWASSRFYGGVERLESLSTESSSNGASVDEVPPHY